MSRKYFGTDGVRGPYGGPVINEEFAARLGFAITGWLRGPGERRRPQTNPPIVAVDRRENRGIGRVYIGRDTRASGPSLEAALARGLRAGGAEPISLGVVPTPAVSRAVWKEGARMGVVVTASHNPAADNGLKLFGAQGVKLTDEQELQVEGFLPATFATFGSVALGVFGAAEDYVAAARATLPDRALQGWRIVIDTANGATCETTPAVIRALGGDVIGLGCEPDGRNINAGVGSEHPAAMAARVRAEGARLGVAHDGDGDRCILSDEQGVLLDGDEILTILATHALAQGRLAKKTLVVTVQSNLGVDAAVAAAGGRVVRTSVGDRYVIERMLAEGATLGGESSGHVICSEVSPTGDGLLAALSVIQVMRDTGKPLSELRQALRKFPQVTATIPATEKKPIETLPKLSEAIRTLEQELGAQGRVLVRYSGTEPKLRLLVEGPTSAVVETALARLKAAAVADGLK